MSWKTDVDIFCSCLGGIIESADGYGASLFDAIQTQYKAFLVHDENVLWFLSIIDYTATPLDEFYKVN